MPLMIRGTSAFFHSFVFTKLASPDLNVPPVDINFQYNMF